MSSDDSEDGKRLEKTIINEGELQSLHEMITEALMTSGNASQLDSVYPNIQISDQNHLRDQEGDLMYLNDNEDILTLGKLYFQFKNLDLRLSRVENVILKSEPVKKRALTPIQIRSDYIPGYELDENSYNFSTSALGTRASTSSLTTILNEDIISINPILTNSSSNEMLSLAFQRNNNNERNRVNSNNNNNSNTSNSAYCLQTFTKSKIRRKDEIKVKNCYDTYGI